MDGDAQVSAKATLEELNRVEQTIRDELMILRENQPPWLDYIYKLRLNCIALERRVLELESKYNQNPA